ncbi:MAG: hypothetical protein MI673_01860 [Thiotrichales bacterium]|nr:hypothetical protein [Thiotrichales bacterium]
MKITTRLLCISAALLSSACSPMVTHFREVADPELPYIVIFREFRPGLNAVVYNPETCQEMGDACRFFRSHAYAHHRLNHGAVDVPHYLPDEMEFQADCWAAKYVEPHEAAAAIALFEDTQKAQSFNINGDLRLRAQTVKECARQKVSSTG